VPPETADLPTAPPTPLRFGPEGRFQLDAAERRLLVDGEPAALGRRAFDLLVALAARPDHLMSKHELLDAVWPGLVVEEANLQMQISNLRKLLGGEVIATVPGRGYRFSTPVQAAEPAPAALQAAAPGSVPPQRLFGRGADLARLQTLLQGGGCVTLAGPAGVGKTSLARAVLASWAGAALWVDLAHLDQAPQVQQALARALNLPWAEGDAAAQLLKALQDRPRLLVLDNAEHLVQACAALATLLRPVTSSAGVTLLVTSQLPLAVAGEQVHRLEPLALPATPPQSTQALGDDALALLVERIVAVDHRFEVTPARLPLLADICARLDGLPLALEMAAARVPVLGLQGVHDALAQRFALLTRGHRDAAARHRSLLQAVDWSYRLLAPPEQQLFQALGVFAGGFTLELAVAVAGAEDADRWDLIDHLAMLVDRSLVVASADDPPRYRMLETLRAHALQHLAASGRADAVRRRHALALQAQYASRPSNNASNVALCVAEAENVRDAVLWAGEHDLALATQLSTLAAERLTFSVWRRDAEAWLLALHPRLQQPEGLALAPEVQAAWWAQRARVLAMRRHPEAAATARHAAALWRPLQQPRRLLPALVAWVRALPEAGAELDEACTELQACAAALPLPSVADRRLVNGALAMAANTRGDLAAGLQACLEEAALARELNDTLAVEAAESNVVMFLNGLNRPQEAAPRARALLARMADDNGNLPWVLMGVAETLLKLGELEELRALVPRMGAAGRRFGVPVLLPRLAQLAARQQRWQAAALLAGHARQRHEALGMSLAGEAGAVLMEVQEALVAALGADTAQTLLQQGRGLDDDAALALAMAPPPAR
jgi:non-specific serine/threonine protein kinase